MTPPLSPDARIQALKKVFAAYRADTSPLVATAYKEGLADIPDAVLVKAIDAAIQGEAFMPTVARIRTYADAVKPEVAPVPEMPAVPAAHYLTGHVATLEDDDPRLWAYCGLCRDTGWVEHIKESAPPYTMPVSVGTGSMIDRRPITVERKSYFSHCKCRATNPKLIADRARTVKYSRESQP